MSRLTLRRNEPLTRFAFDSVAHLKYHNRVPGSRPRFGKLGHYAITITDMKTWIAILTTIGLVVGCGFLSRVTGINLYIPMIVGTSVWAGVDSARLGLQRYQSGISYSPVVFAVLCSMLWIVAFPWFLSIRHKIITGTARLRPEFEPWDMSSGEISPKGFVQPWRGRRL